MESCSELNLNSQISYLQARDPTIHLFYKLSGVKVNLAKEQFEINGNDEHIHVYLRIKKIVNDKNIYEVLNKNTLLCKAPKEAQCMKNVRDGNSVTKSYKFTNIFGPEVYQDNVFNITVKEKLLEFINGYNCSLLTYGTSGSGKTYTIVGTSEEPGIIPRALEYLFRTLPKLPEFPIIKPTDAGDVIWLTKASSTRERSVLDHLLKRFKSENASHVLTYKAMQQRLSQEPVASVIHDSSDVNLGVWVSFAEIYNEHIYDLLQVEPSRGQTRSKLRLVQSNNHCYIKDLTYVSVSSGLEAYQILQYGLHNLNYAATSLNDHSSRSHAIFTIKLVQTSDKNRGVTISKFNFCDLAGSERVKKTHNVGQRLKESKNINTSLLVLGRCMNLVRESQRKNDKHVIPFRESKLTQFFQNALLGNEAISMIVNISPTKEMFDETQCTLNFSAVAKDIIIEQEPVRCIKGRFSSYIKSSDGSFHNTTQDEYDLEDLIIELRAQLEQQMFEAANDRERVLSTYKTILADTMDFWDDKYHKLLNENAVAQNNSIISIDSSSEDLDDINNKSKSDTNYKRIEVQLQEELICLRDELSVKEQEYKNLLKENKSLELTLQDAKRTYTELKLKYENDTKEYSTEIVKQEDKISELNLNIAVFQRKSDTDSSENSETTKLLIS